MEKSEKVARYYAEEHRYRLAIEKLRDLALKTGLEETFKWMFPTYTLDGRNVLAICKFKKHFGIWFFNGVFLHDELQVLENAQEGKTQAMRHWKFHTIEDISEKSVLGYMNEAIENQRKGLKLLPKKKEPVNGTIIPDLLKDALKRDTSTYKAFKELSYFNKKEYSEYIANAKQVKTKLSRLQKILPMILEGTGLNDRYRK